MKQSKKRPNAPTRVKNGSHCFGGRANAGGVNYEVRVAAFIAVKMLSGNQCSVWDGIDGTEVSAITMQAPESVDDVVVNLRGDSEACVFISAKERNATISLTPKSPAFADTVDSFVRQFLKLSSAARAKSRLLWAVPACVGRAATHHLPEALEAHRDDAGDVSLSKFLNARGAKEREALKALLSVARKVWKRQSGNSPAEDELRRFLRQVYVEVYDFGPGQPFVRHAEGDIRSHVVADPKQARRLWGKLEQFFAGVNQRGVRVTPQSLRRALTADRLTLKSPPDYSEDIARLRELTSRNLTRLEEHTTLRFGPRPADAVHIPRTDELCALLGAAKSGHLLITGEPGCGKSGLIHPLVEALQRDGFPVALLLAEEVFGRDWKASANLPDFAHALDEVLANWPDGSHGFLITDALDAVRNVETQKMLRRLLRDVQEGQCGWTVIASVREFDLKHGRELREAFPGSGVAGHSSNDFAGVAHFHLTGLSEAQLDGLVSRRAEISPFVEGARKSAKSGAIHRSPFYLRLAAELLRDGVNPSRLADWNSPAVLLRKFWGTRVEEGEGADERDVTLKAICRHMVDARSMSLSAKELSLGAPERTAVRDLRSRGILQAPPLRLGTRVGDDEICFTHHLLHDYAIARTLIPTTRVRFCEFAVREPLLPIFYRQSFLFALEELWDGDERREGFWASALRLESVTKLHGITRILAPILASRRVESLSDLQPLLLAVGTASNADSPAQKALRHLASGLQDASADAIRAGSAGWCAFAEELAGLLPGSASIEEPLTHILARLNAVGAPSDDVQCLALNAAARGLLAHHVAKEVSRGWRYASLVATETLCRTFTAAPADTERALLTLLTPERLVQFPHYDLFDLSHNIKHLGVEGDAIVLRLFEAAFAAEPQTGQWEPFGTAILPRRIQSSDQWNGIQYALADYYEARTGANAALMTEAACIAWNAVVRRRGDKRNNERDTLATMPFRGVPCELVEDYSHVWGRDFEHEENRIVSHFEKLLREWSAANDTARLTVALDRFAVRNRTSLMWTVLMGAGAEHPSTLGVLLEGVFNETLFFTHPDYAYGGTALLGALHKAGDIAQRERLEKLVLDLPKHVRLRKGERRKPTPSWVEYARNRLLGALEEQNIVVGPVRNLWRERQTEKALPSNRKPEGPRVNSLTFDDDELVDLKEPDREERSSLLEALKPFRERDNNKFDVKEVERHWAVIQKCERMLKPRAKGQPKMAEEVWRHLVEACANIARHATWHKTSGRWITVRRILLKAAKDPMPKAGDDGDTKIDGWPSWSSPSPRIDSACGLPFLAYRLGQADKGIVAALRKLCFDKSHPVRFNLADRLAVLEQPLPNLMWELIDRFLANERRFSVLDALLLSISLLWQRAPDKVTPRLRLIATRAMQGAPADNHIHETLANIHLFRFLQTGDRECEAFIVNLIAGCDSQRASHALNAQLYECRARGWLTAGDAVKPDAQTNALRARTWSFFSRVLTTAQIKLKEHREALLALYEDGEPDVEAVKPVRENLDRVAGLVDGVATQLYFACGAYHEKSNSGKELSPAQLRRFWVEAAPLFTALAAELHPHTAYQIIQTLHHLLPCAPNEVFLLAAQSIRSSAVAGFQHESLAVRDVVKLIERVLADYRDLFQNDTDGESECLSALLEVLDLFVEAGWAEARRLTHRLEEIYR